MRLLTTNFCTETATTVTASSINPNFPASNAKHPFRSKRVRTANGTTTLRLTFDIQTTEAVDSVVLLWSKEDGIRLTNTATIKIQANATNVWTSPAVDQVLTIDNDYSVASHYFTTDQNYRYWSVYIDDPGNPWDYIELGVAWIGKSLDVENAQNGFTYALGDQSKSTETDFGHRYTDEYPVTASLGFSYQYLDYEAIQTLENAFRTNGIRKPVLIAVDPEEDVFNKDHFMVYGMFNKDFKANHVVYNLLNAPDLVVSDLS